MNKLIIAVVLCLALATTAFAVPVNVEHVAAHYYGTVIARDVFGLDPITTLLLSNAAGFWKEMQDEKKQIGSFNELDIFYNNLGVVLAFQVNFDITPRERTATGGAK